MRSIIRIEKEFEDIVDILCRQQEYGGMYKASRHIFDSERKSLLMDKLGEMIREVAITWRRIYISRGANDEDGNPIPKSGIRDGVWDSVIDD